MGRQFPLLFETHRNSQPFSSVIVRLFGRVVEALQQEGVLGKWSEAEGT